MTKWAVHCGCDYHGDHLGCDASCEALGCGHPLGVEVTASTEEEANLMMGLSDERKSTLMLSRKDLELLEDALAHYNDYLHSDEELYQDHADDFSAMADRLYERLAEDFAQNRGG